MKRVLLSPFARIMASHHSLRVVDRYYWEYLLLAYPNTLCSAKVCRHYVSLVSICGMISLRSLRKNQEFWKCSIIMQYHYAVDLLRTYSNCTVSTTALRRNEWECVHIYEGTGSNSNADVCACVCVRKRDTERNTIHSWVMSIRNMCVTSGNNGQSPPNLPPPPLIWHQASPMNPLLSTLPPFLFLSPGISPLSSTSTPPPLLNWNPES